MLEYCGIDPARLQAKWVSSSESQRFTRIVTQITEDIKALGPNRKLRDAK